MKVGDKVKLRENASDLGTVYQHRRLGTEATIKRIDEEGVCLGLHDIHVVFSSDGYEENFRESQLELLSPKVYESDHSNYVCTVIHEGEYKGKKYVVTVDSDDDTLDANTEEELLRSGWKLKTDDTELTLAQVAEKFNIPLDKLRIKE